MFSEYLCAYLNPGVDQAVPLLCLLIEDLGGERGAHTHRAHENLGFLDELVLRLEIQAVMQT